MAIVPRKETYLDQLNKQVKDVPILSTISVDRYLLSGRNLLNQANAYREAGDLGSVYVFVFRFANLMLSLPKHPKHNKKDQEYCQLRRVLCDKCIPELENLKKKFKTKQAMVLSTQRRSSEGLMPVGLSEVKGQIWQDSGAPNRKPLPPRNTDTVPPAIKRVPSRNAIGGALPAYESKYAASRVGREKHSLFGTETEKPTTPTVKPTQTFPLYPSSIAAPTPPQPPPTDQPLIELNVPQHLPLGPQEMEVHNITPSPTPPGEKATTCGCQAPVISQGTFEAIADSPVVVTEEKSGFRDVHISEAILREFMSLAKSNTMNEIETCAILAGELRPGQNVLEVNHLLVPRQKGTRDQVEMIDEELLLGEVLSKGLMVLGWIHTHPIYQCFLSSIDVHTTLPYQLLLEEAVAIVMAPTDRKRECGVFRLTTPGGMDLIRDCPKRGFHQHGPTSTGQPIYEIASRVYCTEKLKAAVTDMR